jgi:tellurite resistance protein TerC
MAFKQDESFDADQNPIVKAVRRFIPLSQSFHGKHFFTVENGKRIATPLLLVLVLVEFTDLIFAIDSIPAIFGVTRDPFIVYTSNIFAILGLRALYFALAAVIDRFVYLKQALALVLVFIGAKIFIADIADIDKVPASLSLGVTVSLIAGGIAYSLWRTKRPAIGG